MDTKQFISALNQIAEEKGIPKEKVVETIEMAIAAAYKKDYGERGQIIKASMDAESGDIKMFQVKIVVDENMLRSSINEEDADAKPSTPQEPETYQDKNGEEVKKIIFNSERHIMLVDARKKDSDIQSEDEMIFNLETRSDFGRIAAQTAKQVVIQRLREAEREMVLAEYKAKEGEIVNAQVQRFEWKNVIIDLGKTSGIMYYEEQIPQERYRIGGRMKVYIVRVETSTRGPSIVVSRAHPSFVKKLFELEVPEIATGTVEIKAIAREAGSRTKIAVSTSQDGIDPIGSCVGQKGTRVSAVISELNGEKIDIVEWSDNINTFITNALSPAKVLSVDVTETTRESSVIVPSDQLSLAIGKGGQNVRLAARLTGWKIDVKSAEEGQTPKEKKEGENKESQNDDENKEISEEDVKMVEEEEAEEKKD